MEKNGHVSDLHSSVMVLIMFMVTCNYQELLLNVYSDQLPAL